MQSSRGLSDSRSDQAGEGPSTRWKRVRDRSPATEVIEAGSLGVDKGWASADSNLSLMEKPPAKSTAREVTETAVESAVGMVPIVGSPLARSFAIAMGWTYNRRMQQWLEDLADEVSKLQARTEGLAFDDLANDEVFVDAVVNATRAAQATHQDEKLEALRNGVLHSLGADSPTIDEQSRFFRLVEQFTPAHMRLLAFLHDPGAIFDEAGIARPNLTMGGRSQLLEQALSEFKGRRDWYDLLTLDVTAAQLTNGGDLHVTQTGGSLWEPATSALGERFLKFISPVGAN